MTGQREFLPGEGSLLPISAADRARILAAGISLEMCERCNGTGVGERHHDDEGSLVEPKCAGCSGRGAVTDDGVHVPETLRAGKLHCDRCTQSALEDGDCGCCAVCNASPHEACDAQSHALAERAA